MEAVFSRTLEASDGLSGLGGLGHTRLSVIDLSERARQPMPNEDHTVWITYNGEVYNFAYLREELERKGHRFRSRGDSEVVLHAYEEWGSRCVRRFDGMFAFGILDLRREEIFLARDRLGIKPLFYYDAPGSFAFASEPKALLQCRDIPRRLDPFALFDYLVLGYTPSPRSFFRGIRRLPPGHVLTVRLGPGKRTGGGQRVRKYWDVRFGGGGERRSHREMEESLRDRLADAVRARLVSDVPLGAFLSGGIDSSSIVSQMVPSSGRSVQTFSIGFPDPEYSELEFAQQVSETLGTEHREEVFGEELIQAVPEILHYFDEPLADTSILPTFGLCALARKHVTVCLSGDGGDELFGGYWQHGVAAANGNAARIPRLFRPMAARFVAGSSGPRGRVAGWIEQGFGPAVQECVGMGGQPRDRWARQLIRPALLDSMRSYSPYDALNRHYLACPGRSLPLDRIQYVDLKAYLPEDILTKVDRASMAFGLEVRVPFLDHRMVEFAARIPPGLRVREGRSKAILKDAFSDILPAGVLERPKQGFAIPEAPWLGGGRLASFERMLTGNDARVSEVLLPEEIPEVFTRFRHGDVYLGRLIWGLYILEQWMRMMDRAGGLRV